MAPEMVDKRKPANEVARRAGLVKKVRALDGVACVLPGTSVEEGQLLISGVEDTDTVGARVLAGMGTVQARTWYTLTCAMSLSSPRKQDTGEEKTLVSLVFGTHRVKFFANSSIEGCEYDKITKRRRLDLLGLPLPVTLVTERCRMYEAHEAAVEPMEAKAAGEQILTEYLHTLVDPYGTVESTLCTARQKGDTLLVTLTAECQEQIGESVPIYTENPG